MPAAHHEVHEGTKNTKQEQQKTTVFLRELRFFVFYVLRRRRPTSRLLEPSN